MRAISYILVFLCFACDNSKLADSRKFSLVSAQSMDTLFSTKVVLVDIIKRDEMNAVPPFLVFDNDRMFSDSLALIDYIQCRPIIKIGDRQSLVLQFDVSNRYTISELDILINICERETSNKHPEFDGFLEIAVCYSSLNDSWLEVPPPPEL
jgi:hypothetical protein